MSQQPNIIELPSINPFAEPAPRAGRPGVQSSGRSDPRRSRHVQRDYDEDSGDEDYARRQRLVFELPLENPFSQSDRPRARFGGRPSTRGAHLYRNLDGEEEDRHATVLSSHNPFAPRDDHKNHRMVEPVDQSSEPDSEHEEEEEEDYTPLQPSRRAGGNEQPGRQASSGRLRWSTEGKSTED